VATRRAIWSGSISFGLVNIPVRLYTATVSHDISFHQFQAKTGQRIHNKRVAERSGREVPYDQIVKGYEVAKGKVVLVDPKELEALEPRRTRTIEIEQFVELSEIDPILWETTYYLGTDEAAGARKSYMLLRKAMQDSGKVGIGRFVMRTKEYLVTVRPFGSGLALETMYYADEIRDQEEAAGSQGKAAVNPRELQMARQLIEALSAPFELKKFGDTYRDKVEELLKKKARGEEIVYEERPEEPGQVVDLMEALKASLAAGTGAGGKNGHRRGGAGRKESRRPSGRHSGRRRQKHAA
jgi:DNA end-binding protein Ku